MGILTQAAYFVKVTPLFMMSYWVILKDGNIRMKRFGVLVICSLVLVGCGKSSKNKISEKNKHLFEDEGMAKRKQRAAVTTRGAGPRQMVDRFLARVNGVNILASDLEEPRIEKNCKKIELEQAINEELLYQKALEMKAIPNELDIERRFIAIKNHNGFDGKTDEQFEAWFKVEAGLTIKKLKRQLTRNAGIDAVKGMYIQDKCFIAPEKIEAYCAAHPKYSPEKYELKSAFIDEEQLDEAGVLKDDTPLEWIELGWIEKPAITEAMAFVTELEKGQVTEVVKTENGYQIFMLVDKKPETLLTTEERYLDIEKSLLQEERETLESELIKQLRSRASLVYLI